MQVTSLAESPVINFTPKAVVSSMGMHDRWLQPAGVQRLLLCMTRSDRDSQLGTENNIVPQHDKAAVGTAILAVWETQRLLAVILLQWFAQQNVLGVKPSWKLGARCDNEKLQCA